MDGNIPRQFGNGRKVFNWTEEIIQDMIYLYNEEFWSFTEIGKKYDLNKITINRKLSEYGVINRSHKETKKFQTKKRFDNKRDLIIELYEKNTDILEIKRQVNLAERSIYKILKESGVKLGKRGMKNKIQITPELEILICQKYQIEGSTQKSVAYELGLRPYQIKPILIKHKIPIASKLEVVKRGNPITNQDELKICELYQLGSGKTKLAYQFKISKRRVEKILHNNNISERQGSGDWGNILSEEIEKEICRVYQNREMGQHNICLKFNIAEKRLKSILSKYNIEILDHAAATKIRVDNYKPQKQKNAQEKLDAKNKKIQIAEENLKNKENLIIDSYVNQKMSTGRIKEKFGFAMETIIKTLKKYNIKYRERHEWEIKSQGSWGITGYYKSYHFRSMKELSFIINFLEKKNIDFANGETLPGIKYFHPSSKTIRNYYPDFVTNSFIYEIKPKSFWQEDEIINKSISAMHFAKENGLKYRLVDYPIFPESIVEKYKNNELQFTEYQLQRFNKNYAKWI